MANNQYNASWWNKDSDSSWDRVKAAFQRDWEQTKYDFGGGPSDLNQDVPDTVKQAAGQQAIPPEGVPNFEAHESAFRFGIAARQHYGEQYPVWDDRLEETLKVEWSPNSNNNDWPRYSSSVRRAYEYTPRG